MHREPLMPFSLRIREDTLRKGYEEQERRFIEEKVYFNGIFNLIFNIVIIVLVGTSHQEESINNKEKVITIAIQGILIVINVLLFLSFFYFRSQQKRFQCAYEIISVQVILYIAKIYLSNTSNGSTLLNGMTIGATIFNVIIGFNFINKIIMNLYAIFMMTVYQFTSSNISFNNFYYLIFVFLFISLSVAAGYQDEKQRRLLYICSQQQFYLGDQIISHTPVGIIATKFNDSTMKFELLSMNDKSQQLLHLDSSQQSLETFLKSFEIDQEFQMLQRSDLSIKQNQNKEQQAQAKKNEMSFLTQCRFHMMKMTPAYPRDLQSRIKKRQFSTGKNYVLSGMTDKETDGMGQKNNNINTHSVSAEVKQYNGFYNGLYLSLSFSTYMMVGEVKYAIFCINTDLYKRDYHNLKSKCYKYQSYFTNFWTAYEKSLISQIKDWKSFFQECQQQISNTTNQLSPQTYQKDQNFNQAASPNNYTLGVGQQNFSQAQQYIRPSQTKKYSQNSQSDQKRVKSLQKILQYNDGGLNQYNQHSINCKQLNSQYEDQLDIVQSSKNGSYASMQYSPKKEKNGIFQFQQHSPPDQQNSMNFDYFCITQESMNNIQQIQTLTHNSNNNTNNNHNNSNTSNNNNNNNNQFNECFGQNQIPIGGQTVSNNVNIINLPCVQSRNQRQIYRMHYNCHRIMYDFQKWCTLHEMEFGQNVTINHRQVIQSPEQLDLDRLITRIISIFEIIRIEKHAKVIKHIKLTNPQINHNSKKLHIVLFNILHNAFLYCKYQSVISIIITDNQNLVNIQVINEILIEEETNVQYYIQNQFLQESKNAISTYSFDTLNQLSLNFNQSPENNDNSNSSNNGSNNIGLLTRKKGDCLGLRISNFLLKNMGNQDKLKIEVKDQKFIINFDLYIDAHHQRKKQTSIFQRYKKNSTVQPSIIQTDANQSNIIHQTNKEKCPSVTIQFSPSENNLSPKGKFRNEHTLFFSKPIEINNQFTINIQAIDENQEKIEQELKEMQYQDNDKDEDKNKTSTDYYNGENESVIEQSDLSECNQTNLNGVMILPSYISPNLIMQANMKSLQFQCMSQKQNLIIR